MSSSIASNNGNTNITNNTSNASSNKTTPSLTLKREVVLSTHKVLPANKVEKDSLLIRPITSNCEKRVKKDNDQSNKKPTVQYINYSPIKKKSYLQTLKDKIFSPGDFIPTKYESKNQKLIIELSKKLLASSSLLNNNLNSSTSSSSSHSHANSNSSSLSVSNLKNKIVSNSNTTNVKYLPDIKVYSGYIDSKTTSQNKKTLILDLDETLVHSAFKPFYFKSDIVLNINFDNKLHTIHVLKRPYVDEFLEKMSKLFEIVIFTASIPEYANPLLNQLDTKKLISYRLFREHCTPSNNFFIKDLKKVGRDLKDTILIDNNPVSYLLNKHNGIPILTWHSSKTDTELIKLIPFLEYLSKVDDVRECIKKVINGNYVNYREVNKLINMNTSGYGVMNNNKHSTRSELFGIGSNDYTRNSLNSESNSNSNSNNKGSNNDISKSTNVNNINVLSKKKFSTFYFDTNTSTPNNNEHEMSSTNNNNNNTTNTKHIGDKIRESLNLNFNSHQSSPTNLFEDKVYKEKYKQFYDIKPSSSPNPFNQSSNGMTLPLQIPSSSVSSDFYSKAYEKKANEIVVLPSNDCRSSSKNIKIKKLSSLTPSTNSNSTSNTNNIFNNLKHNESYSHLQNDKENTFHSYRNSENYQHKNRHLPNYVSPLRESKKFDFFQKNQISSSLSKSLEKKQFDFNFMNNNNNGDSRRSVGEHKIKRYTMTTQTATISLQEGNGVAGGNGSGSVGNYFSLGLTNGGVTRGGSSGNGVISKRNTSHTLRERISNYTGSNLSIKPKKFYD